MKTNFRVNDKYLSDKVIDSFTEYDYKPKKVQSQLIKVDVYDIETFNPIKCVAYANCIYKLFKISGKYYRDITETE